MIFLSDSYKKIDLHLLKLLLRFLTDLPLIFFSYLPQTFSSFLQIIKTTGRNRFPDHLPSKCWYEVAHGLKKYYFISFSIQLPNLKALPADIAVFIKLTHTKEVSDSSDIWNWDFKIENLGPLDIQIPNFYKTSKGWRANVSRVEFTSVCAYLKSLPALPMPIIIWETLRMSTFNEHNFYDPEKISYLN